tara:strand:+ start:1251 stop:1613 length:363 start_codon:yes stop_codon:yes gene_type:complete
MGLTIGKYAFNSEKQAKSKIKALGVDTDEQGNEYPTHSHTVTELGIERLSENIYGEEGELLHEAIYGTDYLVDVLWCDIEDEDGNVSHPYGWATYSVNVSSEGIHGFSGLNYQELKITNN